MRLSLSTLLVVFCFSAYGQLPQLVVPVGHTNPVIGLEADPSNTFLYSIDGSPEVAVWDIQTRTVASYLEGHDINTTSIALSADGSLLATGDASGKVILRTLGDWKVTQVLAFEGSVKQLTFSPDGNSLGVLTATGKLSVVATSNGQATNSLEKPGNNIMSFAWNAVGQLAIGLSNGSVEVYAADGNAAVVSVPTVGKPVTGIVAGADSDSWVATTGSGDLIHIKAGSVASQQTTPLLRLISLRSGANMVAVTGRGSSSNIHLYSKTGGAELTGTITLPDSGGNNSGAAFGIQTCAFTPSGNKLLVPDHAGSIHEYDLGTGQLSGSYAGQASKVLSLAINREGTQLAVGRGSGVLLLDLTGATAPRQLKNASSPIIGLSFGTNPYMLAGVQQNGVLTAWDTKYDAVVYSRPTEEKLTYPYLEITRNDEVIVKKVDNGTGLFPVKTGKKPKIIKLNESFDQRLTPDGRLLLAQDADKGLTVYDTEAFKKQRSIKIDGLQYFEVSRDGQWIAAVTKKGGTSIELVDLTSGKAVKQVAVPASKAVTKIKFDPTGNFLISLSNVVPRGSSTGDYSITFWDLQQGREAFQLTGHSAAVSDLAFSKDGKVLFSAGFDGLVKVWSLEKRTELATLVPLNNTEWAVVTPDGLFDATRDATQQMHYAVGKEKIALDQMKDKFYEPYLLPKLLGFHQEPIRTTPKLDGFDLYPEVKLAHPEENDGKLGISLNDQGGGIGRIVILINGKEVINESRGVENTTGGFASFDYGIQNHPYIKKGGLNKVTVRAYNKDGYLSSPEKSVYLIDESKAGGGTSSKVYGLVAGVSDYEGTDMDLKYAAKDAEDFYSALRLSSESRFGKENVDIRLLSTQPGQQPPTKNNIRAALEAIKEKATSNDYLVVYLSGHGVTESGPEADFYYLTADASSMKVEASADKASYALSSKEIAELIMAVPTVRQVLVIDACHSGQLAQNLTGSNFTMSSEEVRALETLKDRTGLYIIAGSAADAVSYEASAFDQGLLTYSLLYGMKGPALREDRYIDIINLFNFASQKVPELASEIGGIQKPEVRVPNDLSTFDIGELGPEQRKQIVLKANRPAVAASAFQNEATFSDDLQLGELIDQRLKQAESQNSEEGVMFVDTKTFPEAFVVRGRYSESDEGLNAMGAIFQGKTKIADIKASAATVDVLADKVVAELRAAMK